MHIYVNQIERLKNITIPQTALPNVYTCTCIYKRGKLVTITLKGSHTFTCSMLCIVHTSYVLFSQSEN